MRKTVLTGAALLALAVTGAGLAAPVAAKTISCAQVQAQAPYGVAAAASGVKAAQAAGLMPPRVNRGLYKYARALDGKKPKGYVCGVTVASVRQANATGYWSGASNNDPAVILAGTAYSVPGSLAEKYLQYLSRATETATWVSYQSKGLVPPTVVPDTAVVAGDTVTVTAGNEVTTNQVAFDASGKLTTWANATGALPDRLFAVQGTGSGYGMSVTVDWTFRTRLGQVLTTAKATNTSGRPLRLASAKYTTSAGVDYPGYVSGTCISNGQTIPVTAYTDASAPAGATGKWQIEVLDCDFMATGFIDVTFGPRG